MSSPAEATPAPPLPDAARGRAPSGPGALASFFRAPEWGLIAGLIVILGVVYLLDMKAKKNFFGEASLINLMHDSALMGVLALGAATVIIAGGIDLSVGSVVALSGVVSVRVMIDWGPWLLRHITATLSFIPWTAQSSTGGAIALVTLAVAASITLGVLVGLLHALMINQFHLPPFIATLATMAGLRSAAILLGDNKTERVPIAMFRVFGNKDYFAAPIFLVLAVFMSLLMGTTVLGRHLYALGGNESAARLSGLRVKRLKTTAYCISAVFAAIGGVLFTGDGGKTAPESMGKTYELYAITAAVVGGCSLSGGVGSIRGTVLGLIIIQLVIKSTGFLAPPGIDSSMIEGAVLGTVIVVAVGLNQLFHGKR